MEGLEKQILIKSRLILEKSMEHSWSSGDIYQWKDYAQAMNHAIKHALQMTSILVGEDTNSSDIEDVSDVINNGPAIPIKRNIINNEPSAV